MYTVKQVASMFEVSTATVYNWKVKELLVPDIVTPTGRYKYSEELIDEFIRKYIKAKQPSEQTPERSEELGIFIHQVKTFIDKCKSFYYTENFC